MKLAKEQKDKLEALKTTAEIRAFFEAESIELNPNELEWIAGGTAASESGGHFEIDYANHKVRYIDDAGNVIWEDDYYEFEDYFNKLD